MNLLSNTVLLLLITGLVPLLVSLAVPAAGIARDIPPQVRLVLVKAGELMDQKRYAQALEVLQSFQARGANAAHSEIYFMKGNLYLLQENQTEAVTAYHQALKQDQAHTAAWLNLGRAYYDLGRYAEAGQAFAQTYHYAAAPAPEHLYFSAAAYLMARDYGTAIQTFQRLFTEHSGHTEPEWTEHMVHALLSDNRPREALPYIDALISTYTGDRRVQWQEILLSQYLHLKMAAEARDFVAMLLRERPEEALWWKALAHVQLNLNHYESALAALTVYGYLEALSLEEQKLLADLNLLVGIPGRAAPLYASVFAGMPEKQILHRLMSALQKAGRPEKALEYLNTYSEGKEDAELLTLQGDLLYHLQRFEKAAAAYRQAARLNPPQAGRAWLMAGYAAWHANDRQAGREALEMAAEYSDQKKAASAALGRLMRDE